ncbi:hypothetical protein [Actinoplanes sp. L3-i22]|uniref:hypothetical protein n=1 Tax=Actinoplanes sp. L3-i22 TaxID=2836373 RepID=UPI001C84B0A2|nr:hypothetical protein [Actinoplanes sp. L3-i22]
MTVPYREETPPGWTDAVAQNWSIDTTDRGFRLAGDCPTCTHPTETWVVTVAMVPGALPPRVTLTESETVLVVCDCAEEHEGRPSDRTGCGRAGYLEMLSEQQP